MQYALLAISLIIFKVYPVVQSSTIDGCPDDSYTYDLPSHKCYSEPSKNRMVFSEAAKWCKNKGGHLPVIKSDADSNYFKKNLPALPDRFDHPGIGYWLNAKRIEHDLNDLTKGFHWLDDNSTIERKYINFMDREPNFNYLTEDYLQVALNDEHPHLKTKWQDCESSLPGYALCQVESVLVNGGWSDWLSWMSCQSCGGIRGHQTRRRRCDNPRPSKGGRNCPGKDTETGTCVKNTKCPKCRSNYKWDKDSNKCYRVMDSKHVYPYSKAKEMCRKDRARIPMIKHASDGDYFKSHRLPELTVQYLDQFSDSSVGYWIAAKKQSDSYLDFIWEDDSEINYEFLPDKFIGIGEREYLRLQRKYGVYDIQEFMNIFMMKERKDRLQIIREGKEPNGYRAMEGEQNGYVLCQADIYTGL